MSILHNEIATSPHTLPLSLHHDITNLRELKELRKEKKDLKESILVLRDDVEFISENACYYNSALENPTISEHQQDELLKKAFHYFRRSVELLKELELREENVIYMEADECRLFSNLPLEIRLINKVVN